MAGRWPAGLFQLGEQAIDPGLTLQQLSRRSRRIIGYFEWLAVAQIKLLHLFQIERPRSPPPEYRELVAALIHGAVAVNSLGNCQGRPFRTLRGDQLRRGPWAEASEAGIVLRREKLHDVESIFAICDVRE
jgi:hypothetical protein